MDTFRRTALAFESFRKLSGAFVTTVTEDTGADTSSIDDDTTCPTTKFYLELQRDGTEPCSGTDWIILFLLVCLIHCISWGGRWLVWEPLANALAHHGQKHSAWNRADCQRLSTSMTACTFFLFSAFTVWRILFHKPWLWNARQWTQDLEAKHIDADFKFYYLLYAARFCSDSISLFFEDRRKDVFWTSAAHHLITLGLVLGSATAGLTRMGGVIMFFFDWADPPLLLAKSLKYLSRHPQDLYQTLANRLFEVFAVVFILTRNVLYNYVVYIGVRDLPPWAWISRLLLVLLAVLQTYWLSLLVQAILRQKQNNGVVEDMREKDVSAVATKKAQ
jgi:ceramide synthetase